MIPLRPTINLFYDKIVDDTPIPNGVSSYEFSKDIHRIPFCTDKSHPFNSVTMLYNAMKALEVPNVNLFTGKATAKSLFYPIELGPGNKWDVDLLDYIPEKSLNRIRKDKMKLLVFAPRINHDYRVLWRLRERLDYMSSKGITRDKIFIVLGDLNRTYRKLFDNPNVYGIDWWQIYAQISYKSRYKEEDLHWVFREHPSVKLTDAEIENENFQFENWKPTRIFTALTGNTAIHNTSFISELIYRSLDQYGKYSYNLEDYPALKNYKDFRITDKSRGAEYVEAKQAIIEKISSNKTVLDYSYDQIRYDPLKMHKSIFEDSLFNIVSGSFSPMFDVHYMDEIDVIAPGLGVWRQIAKGHPMMYLGCLNTMGYISNEGYFLPTPLFNQHYDRISSTPEKVSKICDNIELLSNLTPQEIQEKVEELIPFMKKNKERFFQTPNKRKFEKLFRELMYD